MEDDPFSCEHVDGIIAYILNPVKELEYKNRRFLVSISPVSTLSLSLQLFHLPFKTTMKTEAITILALAATGFAQRSNVHIGTEIAFRTDNGGFQSNPEVTINQCCTCLPSSHIIVYARH